MKAPVNSVEVRISCPDASARSIVSGIGFSSWFRSDNGDLVFRSALTPEQPVSEHLKWLYGSLKFERKLFRKLEASGVSVVVCIRAHDRRLHLPPEALLLMHMLHLPTELQLSK